MLLSVVIPTMNERDAISDVIDATRKALDGYSYEIIVVDKSSDDTAKLAAQSGARVFSQTHRGGVGAAFREGFSHAHGEVIVTLDGDGSYDPADIPRVVEPILSGMADFVNGNRLTEEREKGSITILNLIGNRALTWVGNVCFRSDVNDSQSGMKAAKRGFLEQMALFELGFATISELIGEAVRARGRIVEVPIKYSMRKGRTKLSPAVDGLRIFLASVLLMRDYNPLLLYGGFGVFLLILATLTSVPVVAEYIEGGTFRLIGRALLSTIFTMSGVSSIVIALILDSMNLSIRRLEARILHSVLGRGAPHERPSSIERHAVESSGLTGDVLRVAGPGRGTVEYDQQKQDEAGPENLETLERISVRRAVSQVLRDADYSETSPGILRGESGVEHDFDIVASRDHETWVFDICADEISSEGSSVASLYAKILDVKPDKAMLLAVLPLGIGPQMKKLAELYNVQIMVGGSTAQLCDAVRLAVMVLQESR
jgi:glycosyltransferase involved in cell wall biosynthesis